MALSAKCYTADIDTGHSESVCVWIVVTGILICDNLYSEILWGTYKRNQTKRNWITRIRRQKETKHIVSNLGQNVSKFCNRNSMIRNCGMQQYHPR